MTREQLRSKRAAAGAEYAKAISALRIAFVNLAAIERTQRNQHVAQGEAPLSFYRSRLKLDEALRVFSHPEFVPGLTVGEWADPIEEISDRQIKEIVS